MDTLILNTSTGLFLNKDLENSVLYSGGNYGSGYGNWVPVQSKPFDGEKTAGELGNVINLFPNHNALRFRSYEAELKSDVVKIITGKFFKWVVGSGLKLQSEPDKTVIQSEGYKVEDLTEFKKVVEARFRVYANSKLSTYDNLTNLHKQASDAFKTAFLGGDCLIILRVKDGVVKTQVIDGQEVQTPYYNDDFFNSAKKRGNYIINGIEVKPNGEHYGFYVRNLKEGTLPVFEFVEAYSKNGNLMAWMLYGTKHRINHQRGIPQITPILEKVDKLDRYTEASVAGAEERAKIAFFIEHNQHSDGENPLLNQIRTQFTGKRETLEDGDPYKLGELIEKRISATTGKQAFNLPIGAKVNSMASSQEMSYDKFFNAVFMQLCASNDIPPEVALQKYSSNYSASRAAINGWGYLVNLYRKEFSYNFYKNIYNLWLEVEVLQGKIKLDYLLKAILDENKMALEAFFTCKFTGSNMPHIDPLKEVKAMREMLGNMKNGIVPLTSFESVTEQLGEGDWSENFAKIVEELKIVEKNGGSKMESEQDI